MMKRTGWMALVLALIMAFTMAATAFAEEATIAQEASVTVEQTSAQPEEPVQEPAVATAPQQTEAEPAAEAAQEAQSTAETTEQPADMAQSQPDEPKADTDVSPEHALPENVKVTMRCIVGDNLQYGDTVTVVATVQGLDNVPYLVQWQYDDGAGWKNREGATQASYSFTLSRENAAYQWRVMVTVA